MKISIMQPYFFPYLGYFSLIKNTDEFILLDSVQFMRHGWIERNRILKQGESWLYIKVPLKKHHQKTLIKDIRIDNEKNWQSTILSQLEIYKKIAPCYSEVTELISEVFKKNYDCIADLNETALKAVCDYLGFKCSIKVFSKMGIEIEKPTNADEWALNICKKLGNIGEYCNPPGGKEFFDRSKYEKEGIELKFQNVILKEYNQGKRVFEPGLSIIDVMMFNSPKEINKMLNNYEVE
jgi:hypothetical protein